MLFYELLKSMLLAALSGAQAARLISGSDSGEGGNSDVYRKKVTGSSREGFSGRKQWCTDGSIGPVW